MNWIQDISLISGPLPLIFDVLGVASIIFLLFRASLRWWLFAVASAVAAVLVSMVLCWAVIHVFYWWPEDLPAAVVLTVALMLWVLILGGATALAGLRRRRSAGTLPVTDGSATLLLHRPTPSLRRVLAVVATATVLAVAGLQMNAIFGEFPTVGKLFGAQIQLSSAPPPAVQHVLDARFMATAVSQRWSASAPLPASGTVLSVAIAGTESGFKARNAVVYLPPAYSAPNRPVLPVLVLVSGQPGSPESWLRSTSLVRELDSFAAAHGGLAPLVVIPDPNGSEQSNTMCMDSTVAQADTYMSKDVPAWIKEHLDADTNPAHWAVGGFSYGGTCAMQMVTRHPQTYRSFMAISPEREPGLAVDRSITIKRAFHGDTAAFDALLPLTLMAHHNFPEIHGWFASGSGDATYSANVRVLQEAARRAGMRTKSALFPGGHSWAVANEALPEGLAFVFARMGLP